MLKTELKNRQLPSLRSREEMKEIMQREVYGYLPEVDFGISVSEPELVEQRLMCGQVHHSFVNLTVSVGEKKHTFRVDRVLHTDEKKRPLVLLNNFHHFESQYFPKEEMSEYDVDWLVFCYKDICSDDGDFSDGLAPLLLPEGQAKPTDCGKIGIWAWAAMRVLDYGLTLPGTDADNVAIAGHSRLGKTALYTAMTDERFKYALSNAAGCAGDSLAHGSTGVLWEEGTPERGENISDIVMRFPFWFCKNYAEYTEKSISDTFDQHFLLAAIAPRYVCVGSCDLDFWADVHSQQMCCMAASEQWEKAGLKGLEECDRYLEAGESRPDGHIGYFVIHSKHYLSRHSWKNFMKFIDNHR